MAFSCQSLSPPRIKSHAYPVYFDSPSSNPNCSTEFHIYSRQKRSTAIVTPHTVEVAIIFTPEELGLLDAAVRQSGSDISVFVQNAALEAAYIEISSKRK